ncbi:MAG: hypothetical protein WD668_06890, partial [Saccharospirillum sp.]
RQAALELAEQHRQSLAAQALNSDEQSLRATEAQRSLDEQARMEATNKGHFDEFLASYLRQ